MPPNPSSNTSSNTDNESQKVSSVLQNSNQSSPLQSSTLQWFKDIESSPSKIILLSSLTLHLILIFCVLLLCFKYRTLSTKFKRLKNHLTQELDDRKKETTKLHNFFNSTRPPTQSTSGAYFDDCYADQKLLPSNGQKDHKVNGQNGIYNNGMNNRSSNSNSTVLDSPKIETSTPPTPLPRSKSKPEFQLNISNNNNVTETDDFAKPKIIKENNNNDPNNDSWFIPVTPATQRCKSTKPLVQHTPVTERTKHNSGPNLNRPPNALFKNNNNTPPKLNDNDLNNSYGEANTSANPLAGMSLWEQHESRPVLKHQT